MVPVKKIEKFLDAILARDVGDTVISLYQYNSKNQRVLSWSSDRRWNTDDAVSQISEAAQSAADGMLKDVRFTLIATELKSKDRDERVIGRIYLAARPNDEAMNEAGHVDDTPDQEGLLTQLMRHNADLHRQSSGTFGVMFQYLTRIVDRQADTIEKLTDEKMASAEMMEGLISKKHQRDMESKQIDAQIKRKEEMWGRVAALMPVVVNKMAGKELVRQNETELELSIAEFLRNITTDKLDKVMSEGKLEIDKTQMALLVTMMEQISKRMQPVDERAQNEKKGKDAIFSSLGPVGEALGGLISTGKST